jgi:hypothetical protein
MDSRKIIIVSTKTQKKSVIETNATTLKELKEALKAANIDYTNMTFYEGLSKTELKTDESLLPHDVPYKGTITNELVFMLTNTEKKIESGAEIVSYTTSRANLYYVINARGLKDAIKEHFGKNFTQVSSKDLVDFINGDSSKGINEAYTPKKVQVSKLTVDMLKEAITKLVIALEDYGCIDSVDKQDILSALNTGETAGKEEPELPYSSDDIDDMFKDML